MTNPFSSLKLEEPGRLITFAIVFIGCVVLVAMDKMPVSNLQAFALWLIPSPVTLKKEDQQ